MRLLGLRRPALRGLASTIAFAVAGCASAGSGTSSAVPLRAASQHGASTSYGYCPAVQGGTGILPDGDFSQALNPGDHNLTPDKGTVFAPGWIVSKGNIDFNGTTYWDMDGLCSVDPDGDLTVGGIKSSAFRAKRDGRYTLSFVMSGNGHCAPTIKTMKISIDKQFTTLTWNTAGGNDVQDGDYAAESWTFIAKPLSVLTFNSQDPPGSGCGVVIAGIAIAKQ
jgi:hypothetical protein